MKETDLVISNRSGCYIVTVSGRANFEYAVPLRDLAHSTAEFSAFQFDMKECTAMDSTFTQTGREVRTDSQTQPRVSRDHAL